MAPPDIQSSLALAERAADGVAQALVQGQPELLEAAARDLQQAALALVTVMPRAGDKQVLNVQSRQRLDQVLRSIAMLREACMRRSAVVEMALHSMLPAARATTYAGGAAPYAHNTRQTGAFKLLAA